VSVGYDKDVGTCTGAGETPEEAIKMAYKTAEGVAMTGLLYRPKFDFMSKAYFTSIMNRYNWLKESGLI
jgi:phosphoribosylamine-glycine ligase